MAFLIGGGFFVVDTALVAGHMASGTEPAAFSQALVGASWTAAFIGLLGFYPSLNDRGGWLPRVGAVFAVVGAVTMAAMATAMLGHATGVLSGDPGDVAMCFLPGVGSIPCPKCSASSRWCLSPCSLSATCSGPEALWLTKRQPGRHGSRPPDSRFSQR